MSSKKKSNSCKHCKIFNLENVVQLLIDQTPQEKILLEPKKINIDNKNKIISEAAQKEIINRVEAFNAKYLAKKTEKYFPTFKGKFIYLMRIDDYGQESNICRLAYNESLSDMNFAIFKYSSSTYAANEWLFPGSEYVNGTLEGAMKAGLKAYPV